MFPWPKKGDEKDLVAAGQALIAEEKTDRVSLVDINDNDTYGSLMQAAGVDYATLNAIYDAALPLYDLAKIRTGRNIELTRDKNNGELKQLLYKIDSEDELKVVKNIPSPDRPTTGTATTADTISAGESSPRWTATVEPIPYEVRLKTASGQVETSMYQAALDHDIDIRAIIELANAFQWSIDFAMDPRQGDAFKFVYEERYLDGKYVMPGRIFAGEYINDGTKYAVYYFEETADNSGFFDEKGNSVQKMFLKAPVEFRYISSGYSSGSRVVMELGLTGPHRAIDYAAALGTPVRTVGDGTAAVVGRDGGYGQKISIRHNGTYSTNYCHLSKYAVKTGQKVKQGQVIGYVGSTGMSTGPHLHYEMVKNGAKIDPLREILPPGKPIKEENRDRFFAAIKPFQDMLGAID